MWIGICCYQNQTVYDIQNGILHGPRFISMFALWPRHIPLETNGPMLIRSSIDEGNGGFVVNAVDLSLGMSFLK